MASHKVPQNVEAEDKLLGPLSLKQLIFTMVGLGFGYLVFFFFTKVHPLTAIIWLPFMTFFLVLGLWQRKDQPVEVYLQAAIKYRFGEHKKVWNQDVYHEHVIITAPPKIEKIYTKSFSGQEAMSRLQQLSAMMDSRGLATQQATASDWQNPQQTAAVASQDRLSTNYSTSTQTSTPEPVTYTSDNSIVSQDIEQRLAQAESGNRENAMRLIQQARGNADPKETRVNTPTPTTKNSVPPAQVSAPTPIKPIQPARDPNTSVNSGMVVSGTEVEAQPATAETKPETQQPSNEQEFVIDHSHK